MSNDLKAPNIILIVLDALRADKVLSTYKNKNLTPTIRSLLQNSIYFNNCIANSTWTVPSHINMFTGLYQTQKWLLSKSNTKFGNKIPILTEILKDLGYFNICFTENPWINEKMEFTRGFDIVLKNWKPSFVRMEKSKIFQTTTFFLKIINLRLKKIKSKKFLNFWYRFKNKIEAIIIKMLQELYWKKIIFNYGNDAINKLEDLNLTLKNEYDNRPFYLFFNIMATHGPYIPIDEVKKYFGITTHDFKIIKNFLLNPLSSIVKINIRSKYLSEKKIKIVKKLYNACVFYSDQIVNKIISILKNLKLLENSYVIITSDHGEHLCEMLDHYLRGHGTPQSVYEALIRVPLVIYNTNFKKKIIKNQIELKDLFHTILHLTGVPVAKNKFLNIHKSIIHQINNNSTPKYIFGEFNKLKERMIALANNNRKYLKKFLILKLISNIYFLRSDKYKYIKYSIGVEEFYDLLNDPFEKHNIINKKNENFIKMKLYLEKFLNKINNADELKELVTEREKDLLKKGISRLKINDF